MDMDKIRYLAVIATRPFVIVIVILFTLLLYQTVPLFGFFFIASWTFLAGMRIYYALGAWETQDRDTIEDEDERERINRIIEDLENQFEDRQG